MSDTRHTVLVVDDTPDNITILATSLGDTFRVRAATSGERALAICRSDMPPDIVLLDVVMPSLDGFEVCRQLKADPLTAGIPVLFVTGNTDQEDEARGFALGAVDYISRPIKVELVRRRVQVHLDLQDARRRIEELNRQYACYLPTQLARKLDTGGFEAEPVAHRRKLTVFFSDIVAFTQHTESLAPEHLAILLNGYFEAMNEVVDRHGGTLDKFMGDGMMVFFGAPESRGEVEDAEACVRMALDMQDLLVGMRAEWFRQGIASPLRVRMGIATDYCHVGSFGSTRRLDYTVIGRSVNLASRLQSAASPDTVLVSPTTRALLNGRLEFKPTAPLTLKGLSDPIIAYVAQRSTVNAVRAWSAGASQVRVAPGGLTPPERRELAALLREIVTELDEPAPPTDPALRDPIGSPAPPEPVASGPRAHNRPPAR